MTDSPGDEQPQPQPPQQIPPPPYPATYPPPAYYQPMVPKHENAMTALILGIVGLGGGLLCYLPILCAPFAWVIGARAVREIDASGGRLGGRSEAQTGKVLGIIGTGLLVLGIVGVLLLVTVIVATET